LDSYTVRQRSTSRAPKLFSSISAFPKSFPFQNQKFSQVNRTRLRRIHRPNGRGKSYETPRSEGCVSFFEYFSWSTDDFKGFSCCRKWRCAGKDFGCEWLLSSASMTASGVF
ncbi:hypothetical protein RvY_08599, partial [Ramazzottius varieornatus]